MCSLQLCRFPCCNKGTQTTFHLCTCSSQPVPSLNPHHPHTNLQDFLDSKVWLCWGQLLSRHWPAVRCVRSCLLNRSRCNTRDVRHKAILTVLDLPLVDTLVGGANYSAK